MKYKYLKSLAIYESVITGVNESRQDLNTVKKMIDAANKEGIGIGDEVELADFIYNNFERITGEQFESMIDFLTDDNIADLISTLKMGEEVAIEFRDKYAKGESMEEYGIFESDRDEIAQSEFGLDYDQLGKGEREWVDDEIDNMNEGRTISIKRKYRDRPAISVGKHAPIREAILSHVKECGGVINRKELVEYIKLTNENEGRKTTFRWVKENSKYLKYSNKTDSYKLTEMAKRVLSRTSINEEI